MCVFQLKWFLNTTDVLRYRYIYIQLKESSHVCVFSVKTILTTTDVLRYIHSNYYEKYLQVCFFSSNEFWVKFFFFHFISVPPSLDFDTEDWWRSLPLNYCVFLMLIFILYKRSRLKNFMKHVIYFYIDVNLYGIVIWILLFYSFVSLSLYFAGNVSSFVIGP